MRAASDPTPYRRDGATWTAFGALFAFGIANAMLGPALPYVRRAEHISYFVAGLHQAAFAIGGLTAGALAARARTKASRRRTICGGLTGAAVAAIGLGYGPSLAWTLAAALAVGFFAVTALIRLWAALADQHGQHRAVAMTEGEVAVSFAGILTPLLIGGLAASALTWRFSFAVVAVVLLLAAGGSLLGPEGPAPVASSRQVKVRRHGSRRGLVVIFAIVALEFTLSFWAATYLQDDVGRPGAGDELADRPADTACSDRPRRGRTAHHRPRLRVIPWCAIACRACTETSTRRSVTWS